MNGTATLQPQNATLQDLRSLARLLAESLFDDPLQRFLFPDDTRRLTLSERMFHRLVKQRVGGASVRVIRDAQGGPTSVAVWGAPYPPTPTRWERYADSLFLRYIHGRHIREVRRASTLMAARHPPQPYWYLQALATASNQRGRGHARRLLEEKFGESDASGLILVLETSNPRNLAYYQNLGFQTAHELLLADGLPVWLMCRSPGD